MKFRIALALVALSWVGVANAQCRSGRCKNQAVSQPVTYVNVQTQVATTNASNVYQPVATLNVYQQVQQPTQAGAGDETGVISQVNAQRAQHGLPALSIDINLSGAAATNNSIQRQRGLGHFFMSGRRQNAAVGQSSSSQVIVSWMNSPGHRNAILDPSASRCGAHFDGYFWTLEIY